MWREYLTYPQHVSIGVARQLDALVGLIRPALQGDRYSIILDWLQQGEAMGLITFVERHAIMAELGQHI